MRWFNELQRISTSPDNAVRFQLEFGRIDVRDILSRVKVPTIVLHAQGDQVVPFEEGRHMASKIPGAQFVALESANHILLSEEPAWSKFLYEVRRFVGVKDELLTERSSPGSLGAIGRIATSSAVAQGKEAREADSVLGGLTVASLSLCRVVGNYMRYDQAARNTLKDARQKMVAAFHLPSTRRENYLLWAAPGSGKTYFISEVAASLDRLAQYRELNLAKLTESAFRSALGEVTDLKQPCLCLIDEVDAKSDERWPYELLLPFFDSTAVHDSPRVFVVAGSSGSGPAGMKERIASRPKGADMLSRIPVDNEYSVPGMGAGDRIVVALSQFRLAGKRLGRDVREVEKLGLYYVALNRRLTNARQLHELAVRAVERMSPGDDRVKDDNIFNPGDPENKAFWGQYHPVVRILSLTRFAGAKPPVALVARQARPSGAGTFPFRVVLEPEEVSLLNPPADQDKESEDERTENQTCGIWIDNIREHRRGAAHGTSDDQPRMRPDEIAKLGPPFSCE